MIWKCIATASERPPRAAHPSHSCFAAQRMPSLQDYAARCESHFAGKMASRPGVRHVLQSMERHAYLGTDFLNSTMGELETAVTQHVAIILRGFAFRSGGAGSVKILPDKDLITLGLHQKALHDMARDFVAPFERDGGAADLHLSIYDTLGEMKLKLLLAPFVGRIATVTRIRELGSAQVLTTIVALSAVQRFVARYRRRPRVHGPLSAAPSYTSARLNTSSHAADYYDAVILTRYDLHFKVDVSQLLGPLPMLSGFRFWFREMGGHWRDIRDEQEDLVVRYRQGVWNPASMWRQSRHPRLPDTLIAFPAIFLSCFTAAVRRHGTRRWTVNGTVRRHDAFVEADTTAMDPVLHYIWSLLAEALRYEITWTSDGEPTTASPNEPLLFDYLLKNSGFDSNPCRAKCMLNPAYNIVPRDDWVEQAALCQAAADFLYDHQTQSICCPSLSYCCPNSINSCADPRAILLDVTKLTAPRPALDRSIAIGWFDHFASRGWAACPAKTSWNNWTTVSQAAPWRRRCASTVTDASLRYLIRVWTDHYGPAHAARAFYLPPEVAAEWLTSTGGSNESNTRAKKRGSAFKAAFG